MNEQPTPRISFPIPDSDDKKFKRCLVAPMSRLQKYRLTDKGRGLLEWHGKTAP
jgi:hypothetical protein